VELRVPELLGWGLFLIALLAAAVLWRDLRRRRGAQRPVANSGALTRLPAFRAVLRAHRARTTVLAAAAAVVAVAGLVGAARPVDTTVERPQSRSRDIMLCLDVSGSMASYDAALVGTFRRLVTDFEGERIGLVIFNGSAATVFPLTDDYDYIHDELDAAGHLADRGRPCHLRHELRPGRHATGAVGRPRHRQRGRRTPPGLAPGRRRAGPCQGCQGVRAQPHAGRIVP
jgi:hypothetical protein